MPDTSFNTLTVAQGLETAGIERNQAEAIADAIYLGTRRTVTKADLEASIAYARREFIAIRWVLGTQAAIIVAFLGMLLSSAFGVKLIDALW